MSTETWLDQPFDEWDVLDDADEAEDLALEGLEDDFEDDFDAGEMPLDAYEYQPDSALYLPSGNALVSGPTALALAGAINPLVGDALDGEDVDEFFGRLRRAMRKVGGFVKKGLRAAGGQLLKRAFPFVQKLAGFAGPWGRLISAGLGAARGLMEGKGLRGALAGALSGAIPGIGGKLSSAVLRAEGADDDAALDALADLADAGQLHPALAYPIGAGLASRVAARSGAVGARRLPRATVRSAESWLARLTRYLRGTPGMRLRVMRSIGRRAGDLLVRHPQAAAMRGAMISALRRATHEILDNLRRQGGRWASTITPTAARRRLMARRTILRRVGAGAGAGWGYPTTAAA